MPPRQRDRSTVDRELDPSEEPDGQARRVRDPDVALTFGDGHRVNDHVAPSRDADSPPVPRSAPRPAMTSRVTGCYKAVDNPVAGTLARAVPTPSPAVIELAFDPILRVDRYAVRLETIAVAVTILAALVLAARIARMARAMPLADVPPERAWDLLPGQEHLRRDDLLFIALGIIPGAVAGGRLGYVLVHVDYFGSHPGAILDPGQGALQLSLAVLGGLATGWLIAGLLETPAGRWLHVATLPVLVALAGGKLALVLGGDGQGAPVEAPWATAYGGGGPWGSLGPDVPSHPAQLYEGLLTIGVVLVMMLLLGAGRFRERDGRAFFVGLGLWAIVRFAVAFTWRDPAILGPIRADQLLAGLVLLVAIAGYALAPRMLRRETAREGRRRSEPQLEWPDPAARPRF
jgi:prolipoprotein diacylglyceryltransferase